MTIREQLLLTPTRESLHAVMKIQHSQRKINKEKRLECNSWVIQQLHVKFYKKLTNYFSKMAVLFYFISPPMIYEIPLIIFNVSSFYSQSFQVLYFSSVQFSGSVVSDSATPWTAAQQASLSINKSQSLLKLMSVDSVMPSNHLILLSPSPPACNHSQHQDLFQ